MCKYSHITVLENEGKTKTKSTVTKCFWCHNNVLVHTTGNQRHQFATIYFQYPLAFYNCVEDGRITNYCLHHYSTQRQDKTFILYACIPACTFCIVST